MSKLLDMRKSVTDKLMRDAICEAGKVALAEVGFSALTMERVAEAAGVSKGTLYNYFRDKDALALEIASGVSHPVHEELVRLILEAKDIRRALVQVAGAVFNYVDNQRALAQVLCGGELPPMAEAAFRRDQLVLRDHVAELFRRAQDEGILRADCDDPALAARLFMLTLHGVLEERILHLEDCPSLEPELAFFEQNVIKPWFKEAK